MALSTIGRFTACGRSGRSRADARERPGLHASTPRPVTTEPAPGGPKRRSSARGCNRAAAAPDAGNGSESRVGATPPPVERARASSSVPVPGDARRALPGTVIEEREREICNARARRARISRLSAAAGSRQGRRRSGATTMAASCPSTPRLSSPRCGRPRLPAAAPIDTVPRRRGQDPALAPRGGRGRTDPA